MSRGYRIVSPTKHPHNFVPECEDNQLDFVSNKALSMMIRQMSSLVRQAEDIFSELERECKEVDRRSRVMVARINNIETKINNLDSAEEKVGRFRVQMNLILDTGN